MKGLTTAIVLILLISASQSGYGQTSDKDKALEKGREAIRLMDNGKIDESIQLLEEAQKLDPNRFDYPYELAYAYYLKEDYKRAIKILEKNENHQNVTDVLYQLLGNSYDILGKSDKALDAYDAGIKKFPGSGRLYLEKGNVFWGKKEYMKALPLYEKGIEAAPNFPSNYYRLAKLYCASQEEMRGMIYGEIFMNLEPNSERTAEISKLLFDKYKTEIKFTSDTSMSVSFSQNLITNIGDLTNKDKIKMPLGIVYETTLSVSIIPEKTIDINSLDNIRSRFVDNYFKQGHDKTHPNVLFSYQKLIKDAGQMEAYNHWILMKGDGDGYDKWKSENKDKWENFVKWFSENRINIDDSNKFYSGQY